VNAVLSLRVPLSDRILVNGSTAGGLSSSARLHRELVG
jgi:hypothetical protein